MTTLLPSTLPDWRRNAPAGAPLAAIAPKSVARQQEEMVSPGLRRILRPQAFANWTGWLARDYTPDRVESVLRAALWGDHVQQWELFGLMEDTWPRLLKALSELKRAVVQLDWRCEAWCDEGEAPDESAAERSKLLTAAVWGMRPRPEEGANGFEATLYDLLDAWAKGVSVLEIEWEYRRWSGGQIIAPVATHWVHPREYGWNRDGGSLRLRVRRDGTSRQVPDADLSEFPPDKFLIGICKAKTGPVLGSALLRPLAWWWAAANFSSSWLLNLSQIFGLPIRWATYAPGASEQLINQICDMLENMGSAAWGAFPAGTQVELKEATKTGGTSPQDSLLDRADRQVDLLILGQTLTSTVDDSGSRALGDVHKSVRDEVVQSAADWVASVINLQFVPSILRLNFGDADEAPEFCPRPHESKDLKADADRIAVLMDRGVAIPKAWLYESQKIPLPAEGEEVITKPAPAAPLGLPDFGGGDDGWMQSSRPLRGKASEAQEKLIDAVLEDVTRVEAAWLAGARPWFARLIEAARSPNVSDEQFINLIIRARAAVPTELADSLRPDAIAEALERAMGAAVVNGAITAHLTRQQKLATR